MIQPRQLPPLRLPVAQPGARLGRDALARGSGRTKEPVRTGRGLPGPVPRRRGRAGATAGIVRPVSPGWPPGYKPIKSDLYISLVLSLKEGLYLGGPPPLINGPGEVVVLPMTGLRLGRR